MATRSEGLDYFELGGLVDYLLRTVKAAYVHITCISINIWHGKLNCKFLMNPWQYELGVCNNDNKDISQFCKYKQFVVMATN